MTVAELIENIKKLPPDEQRDIEALVRTRVERRVSNQPKMAPRFSRDLLDRIDARREKLAHDFCLFDSARAIQEFREGRATARSEESDEEEPQGIKRKSVP